MGDATKIEWADMTFNPWVGCTKVSCGCDRCYAESWAKRAGDPELWAGERRRTSAANWQQPIKWNRQAVAAGKRARVFCASLADVFDNKAERRWRNDLWHRIEQTPWLDWLLLTKRPQNIAKMLPGPETGVQPWGDGWPNVWLGTTAENQDEADRRIPHLLATPAAVRFVSAEPLLGPVDFVRWLPICRVTTSYPDRETTEELRPSKKDGPHLDWIIVGSESGPGARPMHPDWARSIRDQCIAGGVPFFFKQWGEWAPVCAMTDDQVDDCYHPAPEEHPDATRREKVESVVAHRDGVVLRGRDRFEAGAYQAGTGAMLMFSVGKKRAGRMLDGREWNELPLRGGAICAEERPA